MLNYCDVLFAIIISSFNNLYLLVKLTAITCICLAKWEPYNSLGD